MNPDTKIKVAIYEHIVETTRVPTVGELARRVGAATADVAGAFGRLFRSRLLVLEPDGTSIRMAPPFSGIATQHLVRVMGREYFANCAWDALGVAAALGRPGEVLSRCDQSLEPIHLRVEPGGPVVAGPPCVIHFAVPAAEWWRDIVYT